MTCIVGTALICFIVTDSSARTADQELVAFRGHAQAEAQKRGIFPVSPSGYIVSMVPPTISPSDRAQIDVMQRRYESLIYRRALADWFFTRGMVVAIVMAGFCWFLTRQNPNQTPSQPIGGSS
jgi:hypothetical protein